MTGPAAGSGNYTEQLRKIVDNCAAGTIDWVLVDLVSAGTLLQVYGAVSEKNLAKITANDIATQIEMAFTAINATRDM